MHEVVVLAIAQQDVARGAGAHQLLVAAQLDAVSGVRRSGGIGGVRRQRAGGHGKGDEQSGQREHVHGRAGGVAVRTGPGPTMLLRMQMRICRKQG